MTLREKYDLTQIINAAGTFTPLGVSRSAPEVSKAVAEALGHFYVIDQLQDTASKALSRWSSAPSGAVTHCVASAITLSIAATMTGSDAAKIAALPDTTGLRNEVLIPAGHVVNYGHSILQAIRLAGAVPIVCGTPEKYSNADLEKNLTSPQTACLLLVSSRLVTGEAVDLAASVATAHKAGVPVIIDGAAQDMRICELLDTGADLVLVSAHKYLSAPTAGLIIGDKQLVHATNAQEKGIGRAMKASKEAIIGVLAAIDHREDMDMDAWRSEQNEKLEWFLEQAALISGIEAKAIPDPVGMPFSRACLTVASTASVLEVASIVSSLKNGSPSIRVMESFLANNEIMLELVPLTRNELEIILDHIRQAV